MKKVAVIGIDGIGWPILNKILQHNAMPTLNKILGTSVQGVLKSTIPPMTPSAWTSIASGVNPGKHGIFDFVTHVNGETRIVNALDIQYPRIHEMVALKGFKSICINLPLTYPIIRMKNCLVVSDWMAPKASFYPKSLRKYMTKYPTHIPLDHYKTKEDLIKGLCSEVFRRSNVAHQIMENLDWNLLWIVYSESDQILHKCFEEVANGNMKALKIFEEIDKTIAKAHEMADLVFIVSDHGFSQYSSFINVNSFLNKIGLIVQTWKKMMKEFPDFHTSPAHVEQVKIPPKIYRIALIKPIKIISKKLFKFLYGKEIKVQLPYADPIVSKAFMFSSSSFGIYVKSPECMEFLANKLKSLKGIRQLFRRENIYSGPFVNKAPELILLPDFEKGYSIGTVMLHPHVILKKTTYGHHPDGIVTITGSGVVPGWLKRKAEAYDVTPTLLRYMGLPLPDDTNGKPLPNIEYPGKKRKSYDYLKHWQLVRQIQSKKAELIKQLKK